MSFRGTLELVILDIDTWKKYTKLVCIFCYIFPPSLQLLFTSIYIGLGLAKTPTDVSLMMLCLVAQSARQFNSSIFDCKNNHVLAWRD